MPCNVTGTAPARKSRLRRPRNFKEEHAPDNDKRPRPVVVQEDHSPFTLMRAVGMRNKETQDICKLFWSLHRLGVLDDVPGAGAEDLVNIFMRMARSELAHCSAGQDASARTGPDSTRTPKSSGLVV